MTTIRIMMAVTMFALGTAVASSQAPKADPKTDPKTLPKDESKTLPKADSKAAPAADSKTAPKTDAKPAAAEVRKPKLGVSTRNTPHGAVVMGVMPDSPAQKAGLAAGDVIVSVDGFAVGIVDGVEYPLQSEVRRVKGTGKFKVLSRRNASGAAVDMDIKIGE